MIYAHNIGFSIIEFTNENSRKIVGNNGQNEDHASWKWGVPFKEARMQNLEIKRYTRRANAWSMCYEILALLCVTHLSIPNNDATK